MKFRMLWVGKTKEKFLAQGIEFYRRRITHYTQIEIVEVRGERIPVKADEETIRKKEGERLLAKIQPGETVIALDSSGEMFSSEGLSVFFQKLETAASNRCVFVIGGPLGLSKEVKDRADTILALSPMTFTHEMARLILMEQIYRALTIARGESYHK